ncbi:MAG: hypothetical protein ACYCXA_02195 [Actinomycetes bacterium]
MNAEAEIEGTAADVLGVVGADDGVLLPLPHAAAMRPAVAITDVTASFLATCFNETT